MCSAATGSIREATDVVDEERVWVREERDAYESFLDRLGTTPSMDARPTGPQQSVVGTTTVQADRLNQVRQAYRETVMAVGHYEAEYGDTLPESLRAEFGPELADQLVSGQAFTPLVKTQLLAVAHDWRQARDEFLGTLKTEREAFEDARSTLEGVVRTMENVTARLPSEQSLSALIQGHIRLEEAEGACETLVADRQQQRTDGHTAVDAPRGSIADVHSYLYRSMSVTYPVLADTAGLLETLQRTRRQLRREVTARY